MMMFSNAFCFIFLFAIGQLVPLSAPRVIEPSARRDGLDRGVSSELFWSLEELSRLVDISYCVGNLGVQQPFQCLSHCSDFPGFELVTTWNTGPLLSDSCGYIVLSHPPYPKRIIIAFRGTYSIMNAVVDLSASQQEYVPYAGDVAGGGTARCLNCTVHAGFLTSWNHTRSVVLKHVLEARRQHPDYEIVLVGHSLGGAVAALAGLEMQLKGWKPQVTTFGEPRIGNEGFAKFLDKSFGLNARNVSRNDLRFRRVTHVNDPIPLLPMEEWGYRMHGGEIFISKLDLPPSISDFQHCDGENDTQCITGSESKTTIFNELNLGVNTEEICHEDEFKPTNQMIISDDDQTDKSALRCRTPFNIQWNPIPPRYRLWELFFAHRDYFLRIGLCFPGGDPSG